MFLWCYDYQFLRTERKKLHVFHPEIAAETNVQFTCSDLLCNGRRVILPEIKDNIFVLFFIQKFTDVMRNIMPRKWKNITNIYLAAIRRNFLHLTNCHIAVPRDPVCMFQKKLACLCKRYSSAFFFKQGNPQFAFKRRHGAAQGRL